MSYFEDSVRKVHFSENTLIKDNNGRLRRRLRSRINGIMKIHLPERCGDPWCIKTVVRLRENEVIEEIERNPEYKVIAEESRKWSESDPFVRRFSMTYQDLLETDLSPATFAHYDAINSVMMLAQENETFTKIGGGKWKCCKCEAVFSTYIADKTMVARHYLIHHDATLQ